MPFQGTAYTSHGLTINHSTSLHEHHEFAICVMKRMWRDTPFLELKVDEAVPSRHSKSFLLFFFSSRASSSIIRKIVRQDALISIRGGPLLSFDRIRVRRRVLSATLHWTTTPHNPHN